MRFIASSLEFEAASNDKTNSEMPGIADEFKECGSTAVLKQRIGLDAINLAQNLL